MLFIDYEILKLVFYSALLKSQNCQSLCDVIHSIFISVRVQIVSCHHETIQENVKHIDRKQTERTVGLQIKKMNDQKSLHNKDKPHNLCFWRNIRKRGHSIGLSHVFE